ncbi:Nucleoside-diphosphate-sugar epimerase [Paenibacillus sp. UNCCL117]|uniref:NAD-dependent epimerase/dehydratase family protein n=1 Tax=unclassified Paenibacillus TaxID=185978 RepID=UPI0008814098|nr:MULTISPECIES: NAD-dependent epimerase/dehydratase family protein [unclassified Paenibacillus]SDD30146.1 Nucleoside-diphosphate-sugar epimerase [Paenibacillus sp. cl123]SFW40402.1 Nucleoside-diphosphate-sugar epimerase [Paenibacillus sp. UNCCL117]
MSRGRVVVTGASGFTGLHACAHLAALGYDVTAVLRRPGSAARIAAEAAAAGHGVIRERALDLSDRSAVLELLEQEKPDGLLHLAGLNAVGPSWQQPITYMQLNVMSTLYLLDGLRQLGLTGCRTLIVGSMLGCRLRDDETPKPPHPYSLSKTLQALTAAAWGQLFGLHVSLALPSNLIGPGASNGICGLIGAHIAGWERAGEGAPFRLSSLAEARDFVDVRDAVRAYGLILEQGEPGVSYPIGSGRLRTLGEIARQFEQAAQTPVSWRIGMEEGSASQPIRLTELSGETADALKAAGASAVNMAPMRALGWEPVIAFGQSVADILGYHRTAAALDS